MEHRMPSRLALSLAALAALGTASREASAASNFWGNSGALKWPSNSVTYRYNASVGPGLSNVLVGDPRVAIDAGFAEWESESGVDFTRGTDSSETDVKDDNVNLITFANTTTNRSVAGSALAVTLFNFNPVTNRITQADIIFNPSRDWATQAVPGETVFSIRDVATHEIGHFVGLEHSAVVGATMFPTTSAIDPDDPADDIPRTISTDDRGGANGLYADSRFTSRTGRIAGKVRAGMAALGGVSVAATRISDGIVFGSAITLGERAGAEAGTYEIAGLPPGTYRVHAEPQDGPTEQDNFAAPCSGFYDCPFDTGFLTTYLGGNSNPSSVSVSAGATSSVADIVVTAGAPDLNPLLIGLFPNTGSFPTGLGPGQSGTLLLFGDGLNATTLDDVESSDPAMTVGSPTNVPLQGGGVAVRVDVTVPADAVPGPRSLLFRDGGEVALLTGAFDVLGPSDETSCTNGRDDDGDGLIDCDDPACDGHASCGGSGCTTGTAVGRDGDVHPRGNPPGNGSITLSDVIVSLDFFLGALTPNDAELTAADLHPGSLDGSTWTPTGDCTMSLSDVIVLLDVFLGSLNL